MSDHTKIKLRIVQSTSWNPSYTGGRVCTVLQVDGRDAYEDVREFGKDTSDIHVRCNAADEVTGLLAAALGRLMQAEAATEETTDAE